MALFGQRGGGIGFVLAQDVIFLHRTGDLLVDVGDAVSLLKGGEAGVGGIKLGLHLVALPFQIGHAPGGEDIGPRLEIAGNEPAQRIGGHLRITVGIG